MPDLHHLLVFLPVALLISLSPGPNNLLAFRNGMRTRTGLAVAAVGGRILAFAGMLGLVVAGLSAVLTTSHVVFEVVKWTGAVYLVGIGLHAVWANRRAGHVDTPQDAPVTGAWRLARQEFITAAANPKAMLVFTALLPQFVPQGAGGGELATLGVVYLVAETGGAAAWVVGGRWLARRRLSRTVLRRINRAFGAVFVALGAGLAVEAPQ